MREKTLAQGSQESSSCGSGCRNCSSATDTESRRVDHDRNVRSVPRRPGWFNQRVLRILFAGLIFLTVLVLAQLFSLSAWLKTGLLVAAYFLAGLEILYKALRNLIRVRVFDENLLMTLATLGAFAIGEAPEAVAVMLFYQTGLYLEDLAVGHSKRSIAALLDLRPDFAYLITGGEERKVAPQDVRVGDKIIVKPGDRVPLDGRVLAGEAVLDLSALTGESLPKHVEKGDEVLSGAVNLSGLLTVLVAKEFGQSTVSRILELVRSARGDKATTESFLSKFARIYTPLVVVAALIIGLVPPLLVSGAVFSEWIYRALVFLVISCPCALVISIPLGFFGGLGGASRSGILVKGSGYLDALSRAETVVFDKTGTLTEGVFRVTAIVPADSVGSRDLLEYAAYAQSGSNHPIALSVRKEYGKINSKVITDFKELSGHGVRARVKGRLVLAGNVKLMERAGIPFKKSDEAGTLVYVAVDSRYIGYLRVSDQAKQDAAATIKNLKDLGVRRTVMLTGDSLASGNKIGTQLGLDEVYADLLPDQKVRKLEALQKKVSARGKLLFVGDGLNDAPVLARADVGIAMGGIGSDAAVEAADIVLMTDEPSKLVNGVMIARRTRRIVLENILFALLVKSLFLVLGAAGIATLWEAVFADVGVTLLVVVNSLRASNSNFKYES